MLREEGFSAAHGNSLRALVKYLENLSDKKIVEVNIPTGIPLVYELDVRLCPVDRRYLGDPEAVRQRMQAVKNQGTKDDAEGRQAAASAAVPVRVAALSKLEGAVC